jgi:hypothetical protein
MKEEREKRIIEFYAHDYRGMKMCPDDFEDVLRAFLETLNCTHECLSSCRRNGCNCNCGEYHF